MLSDIKTQNNAYQRIFLVFSLPKKTQQSQEFQKLSLINSDIKTEKLSDQQEKINLPCLELQNFRLISL